MAIQTKKILTAPNTTKHPFQIIPFYTYDKEGAIKTIKIKIAPGTINRIIPNNIIDNNTKAPFEGLAEFEITKNKMIYIILKASTNGKYINSAEIKIQTTSTTPQVPVAFGLPSSVEVLLGVIYNTTVYQHVKDNFSLNATVQYITQDSNSPYLPFTAYLIWS